MVLSKLWGSGEPRVKFTLTANGGFFSSSSSASVPSVAQLSLKIIRSSAIE